METSATVLGTGGSAWRGERSSRGGRLNILREKPVKRGWGLGEAQRLFLGPGPSELSWSEIYAKG